MKKKITAPELLRMKKRAQKIAVLTAYSYQVARLVEEAGIPVILVGDSAGMVEAGRDSTLAVSMDEMIYHTRSVARGTTRALVVADMPFMSYQASNVDATRNAGRLVKEGRAEAVKVEGGKRSVKAVGAIVNAEIPVMGHIGLTPQSVHKMGGYRVQGREKEAAEQLTEDAMALEEAGCFAIVLEGVPSSLAKRITSLLKIPTIGIGAGPDCDGQVLVINDMLGLTAGGELPHFVKRYADLDRVIGKALTKYKEEVEGGKFPSPRYSYK